MECLRRTSWAVEPAIDYFYSSGMASASGGINMQQVEALYVKYKGRFLGSCGLPEVGRSAPVVRELSVRRFEHLQCFVKQLRCSVGHEVPWDPGVWLRLYMCVVHCWVRLACAVSVKHPLLRFPSFSALESDSDSIQAEGVASFCEDLGVDPSDIVVVSQPFYTAYMLHFAFCAGGIKSAVQDTCVSQALTYLCCALCAFCHLVTCSWSLATT